MAAERRPHPAQRRAAQGQKKTAAKRPAASAAGGRTLRNGVPATRRPVAAKKPAAKKPATKKPATRKPATKKAAPRKKTYKAPVRVPLANGAGRLRVVLVAIAIALSLCGGRLLQLQGFDSSAYAAISTKQLTRTLPLLPSRGEITDRNGLVLASTEPAVAVTADPTITKEHAAEIAAILVPYLKMDSAKLIKILTTPDTKFVYVAKKVPATTYTKIVDDLSEAKLYGIFRESDPIRTYPAANVAASVVGFVGADGKGSGGIEYLKNTELAGTPGKEIYESAPNGSKIPLGASDVTPAKNGTNYQLTIDSELQWVMDQRLAAQVRKTKADWGVAVTINVKTGEILGLANYPTFDAGKPGAARDSDRGNRAVTNTYEPGSVQKVLTAAALVDSGTATTDTKVVVPPRLASGAGKIKDAFGHDYLNLTMRGVVARSSNIGTVLLARQMEKKDLRDYYTSFGLGQKTGIDLPGEATGILPEADMKGYTRDQISFGQGLSVTAVQMAAAVAGIVNDGLYNPPTVIKSATDSNGAPVAVQHPAPRQVISPEASAAVRDMMEAVVTNSNAAKTLKLTNYRSGGKTGTAERYNASCGCYRGYTTSYIGFAPVNDPQVLTYVVLDNPRAGDTGGGTAAPVYHDIIQAALARYSVKPSTSEPDEPVLTW